MAQPTIKLGNTGVSVNAIGLGCMGMSEFYGDADETENIKVLNHALDLKCTFWDTADSYGYEHANEKLLSKILSTRRSEVFLCTKFGAVRSKTEFVGICGTPEYVRSACEASLQALGVSQIDLYYQHRLDKNVPVEDTIKAMAELVKEGKVKYLGLSECSAETLRRAHAVHPITAIQMEYSPWVLDIEENGVLAACKELGVTVVAYSPLGRGFLTGQIKKPEDLDPKTDFRAHLPRFQGENFYKNLELVNKFSEYAAKKGCTPSQLVLAWVVKQGIMVIPGTKRIKYLEENLGAAKVEITDEEDRAIRAIISSFQVVGDRYAAQQMANLDSNSKPTPKA